MYVSLSAEKLLFTSVHRLFSKFQRILSWFGKNNIMLCM